MIWFGRGGGRGRKEKVVDLVLHPRGEYDQEEEEERKCFSVIVKQKHILVSWYVSFYSSLLDNFPFFFLWKENSVVSVKKNVSTYRKKILYIVPYLSIKWIG